jgi:hypothetical protein
MPLQQQEVFHPVVCEVRVLIHPQVHLHALQVQEPLHSGSRTVTT